MQNKFSFRASLKKSWSVFKTNWVLLVGGLVGYYAISIIFSVISEFLSKAHMGITSILVSVLGMVITFVILIGYYMTGLRLSSNQPVSFRGLIEIPSKLLGTAIIVQLIRSAIMLPIVIIAGILFFIIGMGNLPIGIVIAVVGLIAILYIQLRTGFTLFLSIDHYEMMKPWAIIKQAWQSTKGKEWLIIKFAIKIALINIVGALPMGLGLLVTLPLSLLVAVDFYTTRISSKSSHAHTESAHTDMVVKSPEIEAPEPETETVPEIAMTESTEMNSETGDSETTTV